MTFDDIKTHRDILKKSTDVLFEDNTDRRWHPKVRELLVTTLLLRYDQFVNVLQSHPFTRLVEGFNECGIPSDSNTCSAVRDNIFLSCVNQALEKACAIDCYDDDLNCKDDLMFGKWCNEARQAFLSRNAPGLPVETFCLCGDDADGRGILMDTRTLIDHFNAFASVVQANHMELQRQRHVLNDIRNAFNVESKITSSFIIERLFKMEKSMQRLERELVGEPPASASPSSKGVQSYSVSIRKLAKSAPLTKVTTRFFVDNYPAGYQKCMKSPAWDESDGDERRKCSQRFSSIKKAVRVVLSHSDSFRLKPTNPAPGQHKDVIHGIATKAEERIREAFGFNPKPFVISVYKLEPFHPRMKKLDLPDNTPDDMRKFFDSKKN